MLFFRHRHVDDPVIRAFEESVLETLCRKFSQTVWVLPHLYDLRDFPGTTGILPAAAEAVGKRLYVFSWLSARAASAILRPKFQAADLICFDLEELRYSTVSLESLLGEAEGGERLGEVRLIEQSEQPLRRRWYPVIDYQECRNCLECVNFCLFGVYTIGENQTPLVEQPDQCRDGCPACARVCPAGAILFPEYNDPVIAGRTEKIEAKDDLDRLIEQVDNS